MNTLVLAALALTSLAVLRALAPQVVDPLAKTVMDAEQKLGRISGSAWEKTVALYKRDGVLTISEAAGATAVALLLAAAFVLQALIAIWLLAPAVLPWMGIAVEDGEMMPLFKHAVIGAIIVPGIVAGFMFADISHKCRTTVIAFADHGLRTALLIVTGTLALSVVSSALAGWGRAAVTLEPVMGSAWTTVQSSWASGILITVLDVLVLIGLLLAGFNLGEFARVVAAGLTLVISIATGLAAWSLKVLHELFLLISGSISGALEWLRSFVGSVAYGGNRALDRFVAPDGRNTPPPEKQTRHSTVAFTPPPPTANGTASSHEADDELIGAGSHTAGDQGYGRGEP